MPANVENELRSGDRLSHYEIEKLLGAGGMGEVYLARDTKLDRKVAIKILNQSPETNTSNVARFIQEAKAASALNHPNILVVHEIGEHDSRHFIVTEYIDGQTLRTALNQTDRRVGEILDISIQIGSALNAAHEKNIVHRDIKPENVILRPDGLAKVLDFGLAKLIEQNRSRVGFEDETAQHFQTEKGLIVGTVNYLSPEQAKGDAVDQRTDIFSLGVLLYEMITGKTPFAGDSIADNFANLINKDPQPLSRFATNVPEELERIVSKMLRKNRENRYQTMKDLLIDLKELKAKITVEEKLERTSSPETEKPTAILNAATGDANRQTVEAGTSISGRSALSIRTWILFAAFSALLLGAAAFAWYLRQGAAGPQSEIKSLAVLPLKSLDAGENYLGMGIADAVIRRISQTGELTVRPTSAVRRYLNEETDALTAAKQLTADAVLEGSVQRADDRLRVSVNLLRTSDGASLWADSFDMHMTDIFTIQDTVAQQVAARLRLRLDLSEQARLTKRYTSNPLAYEFYVKGIYNLDQRGYRESAKQMEQTIDYFKKAIEVDPNYSLARAQLAYAYSWTAIFIEPTEPKWAELAKDEVKRSQDIDPQLAESHRATALLLSSAYEGFQNEAAVRELLVARQLNPSVGHSELAATYGHMGLEDLAAREMQRALEIDPTSQTDKRLTNNLYFLAGRTDEYLASYKKSDPGEPVPTWCLVRKGQLEDAKTRIDIVLKKSPDDRSFLLQKSLLLALKGDFSSAEAAIPGVAAKLESNSLARHHETYDIACVYALAGKSGEAVKWLKETAETGFPNYPLFERDPYLNRIRQAPEFVQFMAEMKSQNEKYRNEFEK